MKNLKKQFPINEGWIHATLTLESGHGLTVETLRENWKKFPGPSDAEIGHVEINGNKAKVISREPRKTELQGDPCPDCAHDRPGEIMRCPGVYSLCPTCHGKGRLDGTEASGTTIGKALSNLAETRGRSSADH